MEQAPNCALVVSAHPDDLDFGCNGTVALWTRAGCRVVYVICTNGDKGTDDPDIPAEELSRTRQREQTEAARLVGVQEVIFMGIEDGELENTPDLRRRLVEVIRKTRPQVVFCQDPANRAFENAYVSHRDHREAGEATFDALYPAVGNSRFFPELLAQGLRPHRVQEAFFFGTHNPNHWVDISQVFDLKLKALFCHESQLGNRDGFEEFIRERFQEVGRRVGFGYAEPFRRLPIP
jgi:LmbE family N-acetylglucosaminyl deacetylase